jgi:hypothetical protein
VVYFLPLFSKHPDPPMFPSRPESLPFSQIHEISPNPKFGTLDAYEYAVKRNYKFNHEVTSMAISKKSIIKSSAAPKAVATKAPKSVTASPAAPAGKMVTALRVAKNASLAKRVSLAKNATFAKRVSLAKNATFAKRVSL